jgi:RNA binding exosome subunit
MIDTTMEAINDLKRCVKQYRDVDNEIRVLNREVYSKREARKIVEMEMVDLVKLPQFASVDKLKIDDDGSYIKIQKPDSYSKAWNLSKKDLDGLLKAYFTTSSNPNAEDCSKFIVEHRKRSLIGREYEFERIVREDN